MVISASSANTKRSNREQNIDRRSCAHRPLAYRLPTLYNASLCGSARGSPDADVTDVTDVTAHLMLLLLGAKGRQRLRPRDSRLDETHRAREGMPLEYVPKASRGEPARVNRQVLVLPWLAIRHKVNVHGDVTEHTSTEPLPCFWR